MKINVLGLRPLFRYVVIPDGNSDFPGMPFYLFQKAKDFLVECIEDAPFISFSLYKRNFFTNKLEKVISYSPPEHNSIHE